VQIKDLVELGLHREWAMDRVRRRGLTRRNRDDDEMKLLHIDGTCRSVLGAAFTSCPTADTQNIRAFNTRQLLIMVSYITLLATQSFKNIMINRSMQVI